MNVVVLHFFSVFIPLSMNVQHIPRNVKPQNMDWQVGEKVRFRTHVGSWGSKLVFNKGVPRFSAG